MLGTSKKTVASTCCYCGVGCGVLIETEQDRIVGVQGDPQHPANHGRLCTKGSTLHLTAQAPGRLLYPELRQGRDVPRERSSWDTCLDTLADRFAATIREHGPDSVGFYISGQLLTEDYYVFNKLMKGLIGSNNVDTNSRLCMSSAVAGYKATLGADAPPACYEDIQHAGTLFIAGSNTAFAHPILFRQIEDARRNNPDLKLIVADPRRTDTASSADLHLALLPGTDVALFHGLLHLMLWEGWVDHAYIAAHTQGFDELKQLVRDYTPERVAQICGLSIEDLQQAARWFAQGPTLSLYCMGLNQSSCGTEKNAALINLHLATGQIGKPGAGPFSLTGQPNAMGGREVGGLSNLLSAHRDLANPEHRAEVARLWGVDSVPAQPGKSAVEMFEAVNQGQIKLLWIACTNPAQSMPNQALIRSALAKAELVVVQEAYRQTDTTTFADVLLPARSWGEKEGTVTNSERRISHVRPAIAAPGEARADWEIVCDFARRLEQRLRPGQASLFPYHDVEAIFAEHVESTRGRDLDITGLNYQVLDTLGPQQWPFPAGAQQGRARLYSDGVFATASGRAQFVAMPYRPVAEDADQRYPFRLNTGRLRDQWHGMSRTGTISKLYNHVAEPYVALHPEDMTRLKIEDGEVVRVKSRRGATLIRAQASTDQRRGQVFIPMHWGSQFMSGLGVNSLTLPVFDPVSKQPELKHAAVAIEKVKLPWQLVILREGHAMERQQSLQPWLNAFDYATCTLFGSQHDALMLRVWQENAPEPSLIQKLAEILHMEPDAQTMLYHDRARAVSKRIRFDQDRVVGVMLTGETAAADWLKALMQAGEVPENLRPWMLAPVAQPPEGSPSTSRVVCNCLNVTEASIQACLAQNPSLSALQEQLKCGTQCGSCVPELKRMLTTTTAAPSA